MSSLLVDNSNDIVIRRMRKADGSGNIVDAILTCVLTDENGTQLDSVAMSHEGDGDYRASSVAALTAGCAVTATVTASNYTFKRVKDFPAIEPRV